MRLYYFTNSFPFGLGEEWKMQELKILQERFSEITVIPFSYGGNRISPRKLDAKIKIVQPLFDSESLGYNMGDFLHYLFRFPKMILSEVFSRGLIGSKDKLLKAFIFASNAERILKHQVFKELIENSDKDTYWFFYWGRGLSDVLPFLPDFSRKKIGVRLHRYDIFEFANLGYIPFRKAFYERGDIFFSISQFGKDYLKKLYPQIDEKVKVIRLGAKSRGMSGVNGGKIFQLVSCSALAPVKRVELIVDALMQIRNYEIEWTHIGAGPLLKNIKERAADLPGNIKANFYGEVHPSKVLDIYVNRPFDLFINVSESEGVPVSIMEAFSAGIPAMATEAGGTAEIVDDGVGKLIPVGISSAELAIQLMRYIELPEEQTKKIRSNAFSRYENMCNMDKCTYQFVEAFCGG